MCTAKIYAVCYCLLCGQGFTRTAGGGVGVEVHQLSAVGKPARFLPRAVYATLLKSIAEIREFK